MHEQRVRYIVKNAYSRDYFTFTVYGRNRFLNWPTTRTWGFWKSITPASMARINRVLTTYASHLEPCEHPFWGGLIPTYKIAGNL